MEWDNGKNLAGIIIDLENVEQRFSAGERSESLKQAAQRIYNRAARHNDSAQSNWCREIIERAQKLINVCQ
ncbi:hypothetical protein ACTQ34_09295 [Agathobaculum sp. LCP25S3_E8]|uniref:hypothetical protein n=1 Tax=Agathobaculum sp. LCP25S3_E8 TaxID=3438735 RepID=UPI003F90670C